MSKVDTSPAALLALADEASGYAWGEAANVLRAVAAEKEAQAVPTDAQIAMLDRWMRPEAARELLAQVLAAAQEPDAAERDRLKALNAELVAALKAGRMEIWRLLDSKGIEPKAIKAWPEIELIDGALVKAVQP